MDKVLVLDDSGSRLEKFHDKLTGKASLFFATTAKDAIGMLERVLFDWAFLDHDLGTEKTGYDVALWLSNHPDRIPKNVVIHSLNPEGARRMKGLLPQAQVIPCAWDYL